MVKHRIINKKGKEPFTARYKTKIAATLFAILIWFLVVTGGVYNYDLTIPITVNQSHPGYVVTSTSPQFAHVRIRGQGTSLLAFMVFRGGKLRLNFDWKIGEITISPNRENVILTGNSKNLQVIELLDPQAINLTVEERVKKMIPVKPGFTVKTQPGYTMVGDITLDPAKVQITGPESQVDSIEFIETKSIIWEDLKRPIKKRIDLNVTLPPLVSLNENKVNIELDIQKLMERKIERIPIRVINLPARTNALVIPSTLSLVVEGGVNLVTTLENEQVRAFIDYSQTNKKNFTARIEPIPEIHFRDIEPQRFKVILERITR